MCLFPESAGFSFISSLHLKTSIYLYRFCRPALQVTYWEDDTKPDTVGKVRISGNYTSANVSGLRGNSQYFLTVSAFNTAGTGPQSPSVNVTTKKPREYQNQD